MRSSAGRRGTSRSEYGPDGNPFLTHEVPLVESVWIEPYPDERLGVADGLAAPAARYEQRESVELAFVAALQLLPGRQRATLIMRALEAVDAAVRGARRGSRSLAPRRRRRPDYADFLASRPPDAENAAIAELLALAARFGTRLHILHLSNADALPMLAAAVPTASGSPRRPARTT